MKLAWLKNQGQSFVIRDLGGSMEKRFRALRVVGTLYKVLGVIVLAIGIIGGTIACVGGIAGGAALRDMGSQFGMEMPMRGAGILTAVLAAGASVLGSAIGGLTLFAVGEAIYLFLAIEENTRAAANRSG